MQEDFLHYIWKYKKIDVLNLKTTQYEVLDILSVGQHNHNSGPDFFNAQLRIGGQLWAGNVEIHINSSDWFVHNHEQDKAYDNVILHVVWEHDTDVFRADNSVVTTLELKAYVDKVVLENYKKLFLNSNQWINCETDFAQVDDFVLSNWMERLYFERLENKSITIETLLKASKNNWEAVAFKMLAKNFGLKVNGDAFFSMAQSIDYTVVRKSQSKLNYLEALFFGQSGLLEASYENPYYTGLAGDYQFLKQKFQLDNSQVIPLQFFRLRPANFPTIRLSQFAQVYYTHHTLFSKLIEIDSLDEFYKLFSVATTPFWNTHFTFARASGKSLKKVSKSFVDLLLINTIIPLKFSFAKQQGKTIDDDVVNLIQQIASEKNAIVSAFNDLKSVSHSAMQSQALIQLKTEYCDKNKCMQCAVGNALIIN